MRPLLVVPLFTLLTACEKEVGMVCPSGQVDACSIGAAESHLCVIP